MDGTRVHAGTAGRAGPQRLFGDGPAYELPSLSLVDHEIAKIHDQGLWAQRQAGGVCGAYRLAASTLGTGDQVEFVLPVELADFRYASRRLLGERSRQHALGFQVPEVDVGCRRE